MADKDDASKVESFRLVSWALTLSLGVAGFFLKQTVDKVENMVTTINQMESKLMLYEERQVHMMKALNKLELFEEEMSDLKKRPKKKTLIFEPTHFILKPDEYKIQIA